MINALLLAATLAQNAIAITNAAAQIDAAIIAKGGTTQGGLTNAAAAIAALPSGGGRGWTRPAEWPHIDEILAANAVAQSYSNRMIVMYDPYTASATMRGRTGQYYILDTDPTTAVANNSDTTVALPQDGNYHWIIRCSNGLIYGNNMKGTWVHCDNTRFSQLSSTSQGAPFASNAQLYEVSGSIDTTSVDYMSQMFVGCVALRLIPEELDLSRTPSTANMFEDCRSLISVPNVLNITNSLNVNAMFRFCYSLKHLPSEMDVSRCETFDSFLNGCTSLENIPDLDLSSGDLVVSSQSSLNTLSSLRALPKITNVRGANSSAAINFSSSPNISRDSLAVFTDGEITDGLAHTITRHPDYTTNVVTLTLNSTVKAKFTTEERQKIADALTAKNITLAW